MTGNYKPKGEILKKAIEILEYIKVAGAIDNKTFHEIQELPIEARVYLTKKLGKLRKEYIAHHQRQALESLPVEIQDTWKKRHRIK
ncbi:MAG: hypothetical protein NUV57_06570 [archaeon]|nr:hypothetical protein [archaeon]